MLTFKTKNSTYLLDVDLKRIMRVTGIRKPTRNQGKDGNWQQYDCVSFLELGQGLTIYWDENRATVTNPVISIYEGSEPSRHKDHDPYGTLVLSVSIASAALLAIVFEILLVK